MAGNSRRDPEPAELVYMGRPADLPPSAIRQSANVRHLRPMAYTSAYQKMSAYQLTLLFELNPSGAVLQESTSWPISPNTPERPQHRRLAREALSPFDRNPFGNSR